MAKLCFEPPMITKGINFNMPRLKELDVLRGIAALNVVFFHYTAKFKLNFGDADAVKFNWEFGKHGVELFFVISGFVIFMSLKGKTSVQDFAVKRFLRLYPVYWISVFFTFIILNLAMDPLIARQNVSVFLLNLTMIQGAFNINNIDGAYWSLIPELLFYVFMGVLYQARLLSKMRMVAVIWLTLMITNSFYPLPFGAYLLNLDYGMFFLAGILFYKLKFEAGDWHEHLLIGICFLAGMLVNPSIVCFYIFLIIFLLFYLFVYGKLRLLIWKPLLFAGYISYPLYLIHQNIGFVFIRKLSQYISNEYLVFSITICCMLFIAWLITRFLEKPILHYLTEHHLQPARPSL